MTKEALRKQMKAIRAEAHAKCPNPDAQAILEDIGEVLDDYGIEFEGTFTVGTYLSVGDEFPTDALNALFREQGFDLCVPAWDEAAKAYRWVRLTEPLVVGPHGIPQPATLEPIEDLCELDLVLVPGLAFDNEGNRLGHGAGIYDRLLEPLADETEALICGLAYLDQVIPEIPVEDHDIAMCVTFTEQGICDPADWEDHHD